MLTRDVWSGEKFAAEMERAGFKTMKSFAVAMAERGCGKVSTEHVRGWRRTPKAVRPGDVYVAVIFDVLGLNPDEHRERLYDRVPITL